MALARTKLQEVPRRAADEEDIVVSAFASFCRGVDNGRYPQSENRDDLWRLLVVITARKAFHWMRHETAENRNRGKTLGESAKIRRRNSPCRLPTNTGGCWIS